MSNVAGRILVNKPTFIPGNTDSYHKYSDAELRQRCLKGEDQAWATLLDRYGGLIYSIALKLHLSPDDAADVFQSVCLDIIRSLGQLKDPSKMSSWVATITRRHCYRLWDQRNPHLVDPNQVEQELTDLVDGALLPDEVIQRLEQERLLRQAVSMLDEPCRHLVTSLFYEDEPRPYDQLAQEMGLSSSTLGSKRSRCLKRIRRILDQLNF